MPEFDTYNTIERFARDNRNPASVQAYIFLRRRAELMMRWRVLTSAADNMELATDAYLGLKHTIAKSRSFIDMDEQDRQKLFMEACKDAGVQIDPNTFTKLTDK